jgi:predicted TIM-barrel fold metal-dependent hydrolase
MVNDAHCHFFSTPFFAALGGDVALARLGWDPPGSAADLADRWVGELDRHRVSRAALIASLPGDSVSVAEALRRHPDRFVGCVMVDPTQPDAAANAAVAIDRDRHRVLCLFPAMHRFSIQDERARRLFEIAAARPATAVFVHCGVLSVGVRRKLGLPSPFDMRFSNPLDLHAIALAYPSVPIIVPHFGAGLFREALMLADLCPNVLLDTSSSNSWIKYQPGLTLGAVFRQALAVAGPDRLLFGTDSSFFPRGWVADVHAQQSSALDEIGASAEVREKILGGNFERVFPPGTERTEGTGTETTEKTVITRSNGATEVS